MPVHELIASQLDATTVANVTNALNNVITLLQPFATNLTPEERQRYGSINEQNKLLVNKVGDYRSSQPALSSPDVNWQLFQQNYYTRNAFATIELLLEQITEICSDPRILHDYSLYQNALVDYDYTKYKAQSTVTGAGYTTKYEDIKQFFPNTGGSSNTTAQ